jgi:hypothetical protein
MLLGFVTWQLWPLVVLKFLPGMDYLPAVMAGLVASVIPYAMDYAGRFLLFVSFR